MTIVLDEDLWASDMIKEKTLGKKPYETLCRVAKYYLGQGYSKKETRSMLDSFLLMCDPTVSLPKWSDTLNYALTSASKHKSIREKCIVVTRPEIEKINSLSGAQLKRLAFTLLCLSKFWNIANEREDGWVNSKDSDVMKMANINTSIKRQSIMYHNLYDAGMIQFSKKIDNTNVRVVFASPGDTAIEISDFRNLGYQYQIFMGDQRYIKCKRCGLAIRDKRTDGYGRRSSGHPQKYCQQCAAAVKTQSAVDSIMRVNRRRNAEHKDAAS